MYIIQLTPLAHVKRNWNETEQNTETTLKCFRFVSELFQATSTMIVLAFCFTCARRWNKTEIKHCRRWSAEIKRIWFSFVSVLFQFHFTCASGLAWRLQYNILNDVYIIQLIQTEAATRLKKHHSHASSEEWGVCSPPSVESGGTSPEWSACFVPSNWSNCCNSFTIWAFSGQTI